MGYVKHWANQQKGDGKQQYQETCHGWRNDEMKLKGSKRERNKT